MITFIVTEANNK